MEIPRYITQISQEWLREVSRYAEPGNCIRFKKTSESYIIDVDIEQLKMQLDIKPDIDTSKFVTTDTTQTVTGTKTFTKTVTVSNDNGSASFYPNAIYLKATDGNPWVAFYGAKDATTAKATVSLSKADSKLYINSADYGVIINTKADEARLSNAPTATASNTTSKAIATCGWAAGLFSPKTHNHDDVYAKTSHNHDSTYSKLGHTHSNYLQAGALDGLTETVDGLADIVDEISSTYLTEDDLTTALSVYSTSEDIAGEYLKITDFNAYVEEVDDIITAFSDAVDEMELLVADLYDEKGDRLFVTTDTAQTVTGTKTFTKTVTVNSDGVSNYFIIDNATASTRGNFGLGDIWLDKNAGQMKIRFRKYDRTELGAIYYDHTDAAIHLDGKAESKVVVQYAPTDSTATDSKVVATLGWVNDKFIRTNAVGSGLTWDSTNKKIKLTALTASKWMKTDANGLPTTTNDTPAAFSGTPTANRVVVTNASGALTTLANAGSSTGINIVTDVTWNGTQLVVSKATINLARGIVTGTTAKTAGTIGTVTYTP